ncbi:Alpha/beta hydrolase family protein [Acidaminobacter hydrogenoformans DSM 2784]|uniref:Alpha/beta hydrolase family protein n=2 Tax=Acidaminobacter TaxID=65402 RepID=A0A1G5RVH0_9FIRM|nr:Alpha/beta hydrolase family protein [Acidaminobacter hydrogenoformans DSM 2784]
MEKDEVWKGAVVPGGVYRHFKGNRYKVLDVVRHSETGLPMVLYQPLYGEGGLWVRPLEMFTEEVNVDGAKVKRFELQENEAETVAEKTDEAIFRRLMTDPDEGLSPAPDLYQLILEQGGERRFGVMLTPGGSEKAGGLYGAKPTLLLLHGFPGNERNFDLAHAVRRLGWNVMIFHYRGTWGSDGTFTFENALEDIRVALAYLRSEAAVDEFGVDPERLFIAGNSFGGFAAMLTAQEDPGIRGCVALSVYDLGRMAKLIEIDSEAEAQMKGMFESLVKLTVGGDVEALTQEIRDHAEAWDISGKAGLMKGRPVLLLAGSRDLDGPAEVHYEPLRQALEASGALLEAHLLDSDHGFQNKRVEVACKIGRFLEKW